MPTISWHSTYNNVYDTSVFRSVNSSTMDETLWTDGLSQNNAITLPALSEIDFSSVPKSLYQSGTGIGLDLDLEEINFLDESILTGWYPGVRRGLYRIENSSYYLHSSESVGLTCSRNEVGNFPNPRSVTPLPSLPDLRVPILCVQMSRSPDDLSIIYSKKYEMVSKFTPEASSGREIEGTIDTSYDEFKIKTGRLNSRRDLLNTYPVTVQNFRSLTTWGPDYVAPPWTTVSFSRPDLFKRRVPYTPRWYEAAQEGDYIVRLTGASTIIALKGFLNQRGADYGHVSFQELSDCELEFNKIVHSLIQTELTMKSQVSRRGVEYYVPTFPVFDTRNFDINSDGFVIEVDGFRWQRVFSLSASQPNDNVYEMDPISGTVKFGGSTADFPGATPDSNSTVTVSYVATVSIRYDEPNVRPIFDDKKVDIDPISTSLRQGFIVLANSSPIPYKLTLLTSSELDNRSSCIYGPLRVPPAGPSDFSPIRARLTAKNGQPIPGAGIRFRSLDGNLNFTQDYGITDGAGNVYSEAFPDGQVSKNLATVNLHRPTAANNIAPGQPEVDNTAVGSEEPPAGHQFNWNSEYPYLRYGYQPPAGHNMSPWTGNVMIIEEELPVSDPSSVVVFLVVVPEAFEHTITLADGSPVKFKQLDLTTDGFSQHFTPYRFADREGGLSVAWTEGDERAQNNDPNRADPPMTVSPVHVRVENGRTHFIFDRGLPLPWEWNDGNSRFVPPMAGFNFGEQNVIMQYRLVVDRLALIQAETTEEPILESNILSYNLTLNENMKGQWQIIDPDITNSDYETGGGLYPTGLKGTRLDSATFITPSQPVLYSISDIAGNILAVAGNDAPLNQSALQYPIGAELTVKLHSNSDDVSTNIAFELPMSPLDGLDEHWLKPNIFIVQVNDATNVIDSVIRVSSKEVELDEPPLPAGERVVTVKLPAIEQAQIIPGTSAFLALNGFNLGDNIKWNDGVFPRSSIRIIFQ